MKKVLNIARNDIEITLLEPAMWLNIIVIPAVLIFVIGLANNTGGTSSAPVERRILDVVDMDGTAQSAAFISALAGQSEALAVCPASDDADDFCALTALEGGLNTDSARARLESGTSFAYVEIPAGFGQAMLDGHGATVVYVSKEQMGSSSAAQEAVSTAAQRVKGIVAAERVALNIAAETLEGDTAFVDSMRAAAARIWATTPVRILTTEVAITQPPVLVGLQQSVPGMGSMYVMFLVLAGASMLVRERKLGTLQRLSAAPVTNAEIIGGKLIARFVLGMMQYAVAFGAGLLLAQYFGTSFGDNPLALIAMMAAFTLCISTFTLLAATLVRTADQAGSLVTLLTLILAPIGGAWWSLDFEFIPEFMRTISVISPFKWVIDGFRNVIALDQGFAGIIVPAGVLLAASAVFFALAVRRFKVVEA